MVLTVQRRDTVAVVTLSAEAARNAFNSDSMRQISATLNELMDDSSIRAIVLTGTGRFFCAGADIEEFSARIEDGSITALVEDPSNRNVLYLGTDLGVFASTDAGASWEVLGGGLPTCPVVDLAAHSPSGVLVAVTHGLSAFALEVAPVSDAEGE